MTPSEIMSDLIARARSAQGATKTNPLVAAALVEDGEILSWAHHRQYGDAHAESNLLDDVTDVSSSSTLYCTLEPCVHRGKTPPCVNRIASLPFERIVLSAPDPHPAVNHSGIRALRQLGHDVEVGVERSMYEWVNRAYFYGVRSGLPWIDVKSATSADGYIAPESGDSRWITGAESRSEGHVLRSRVDAVMVGANTVRRDDPRLTDRETGSDRQPEALLVTRSPSNLPRDAHLLVERASSTTVICPPDRSLDTFEQAGGRILKTRFDEGRVNWKQLLPRLRKLGLGRILVEGGGYLIGSLVESGFVNEYHHFSSGKAFGSGTSSLQMNDIPGEVEDAPEFKLLDHETKGNDVYTRRLANDSRTTSFYEGFTEWNDFRRN